MGVARFSSIGRRLRRDVGAGVREALSPGVAAARWLSAPRLLLPSRTPFEAFEVASPGVRS